MQMRTSKPSNNKFYITRSKGGYSTCIQGHPTDASANVLANCVGYACGRFNEIIGSMKYPSLNCNAENFIERAKSLGLTVVSYPTLGGIMVWQKGATLSGNDGAGHVAIVERIDGANKIYTSESGYGSSAFWNSIRTNSNGRWGLGNGYTFRGCIINPAIGDIHHVEPQPQPKPSQDTSNGYNGKFKVGDKVVVNGALYISSTASSPSGSVSNKETEITRVAENTAHPYNTKGDLGWMNESDIKLVSAPAPQKSQTVTYTVQRGDNLSTIAKKFGTTWQDIYNRNKSMIDADAKRHGVKANYHNFIYAGQVLNIK